VPVFCNFSDPSYVWYDAESDYVRFQKSVVEALIVRSAGDVFVDIGAHYGFYAGLIAALLRRHHRSGLIVAVEPDLRHQVCLERTLGRAAGNGIRTQLVRAAIAQQNGTVTLYRSKASCLHSYQDADGGTSCYDVPAQTVDSLLDGLLSPSQRVAMIKIDVDGAEPFVMDGWRKTMEEHAPIVLMEFSPVAMMAAGVDPQDIFLRLCREFHVSHADQGQAHIRPLREEDYEQLAESIGEAVTDLILTKAPLTPLSF
jgi:FkbM family methyltransferase